MYFQGRGTVNAGVGKWRSKYRFGSRAQQALVEGFEQQRSSTCVDRAKVSNGRGNAVADLDDNAIDVEGRMCSYSPRAKCGVLG